MSKFDKYRNSNLEDLVVFNQDTGMYSLFLDEIGLIESPKMRVVSQFLNKAIKEKNLDRDNVLLNEFDIKVHRVHYSNVNLGYIENILKEAGII